MLNKKLIALFLLMLFAVTSLAEEKIPRGKVKLATGEGYFPYVDSGLPDGGWSVSLVRATFNKMNLDVNITVLPWNRALKWTHENKFLGTFPYVYSEKRAADFLFSEPINSVPVHMYVAKKSGLTSLQQIKNKRLCFPFSYSLDSVEMEIVKRFNMIVQQAKDGIACIHHVAKGWSDAGLTNGYIAPQKLQEVDKGGEGIMILPEELMSVPLYFVISREHPDAENWIKEFNHGFKMLEQSKQKKHIDDSYIQLLTQY